MAIGATAEDIRNMVLRDGMSAVVIGMILGLIASLDVNRILQSQLVVPCHRMIPLRWRARQWS